MSNKRFKRRGPALNLFDGGGQKWSDLNSSQKAGSVLSASSGILGAISGGKSTTASSIMSGVGSAVSMIPGFGQIAGPALKVLGGITDSLFGSKLNDQFISQTESAISDQSNYNIDANTNDDLMAAYGDASLDRKSVV